jgi:hypothetical protein
MASARIHLLDIGTEPYGDCVVIRFETDDDSVAVIVDGGHSSDREELVEQFSDIFGGAAPFDFDLMIISHGHLDHIGALPWLIKDNSIRVKHALIPDPDMTFGPAADIDAIPDAVAQAVAVLREEPVQGLLDSAAVEEFALDALSMRTRYDQMIENLEQSGCNVVLFGNSGASDAQRDLVQDFAKVGFKILGPSQDALDRSASLLFDAQNDAITAGVAMVDEGLDGVETLDGLLDAESRAGNLVNTQSIVCLFEISAPHALGRILLGGDYQFEDIERDDDILEAERLRLLGEIRQHAPYAFAKLSHHGSENASGTDFFDAIGNTKVVGICSGRTDDPKHPDPETIELLEEHVQTTSWVRTDRSGHVKVSVTPSRTVVSPSSAKNISEPNTSDAVTPIVEVMAAEPRSTAPESVSLSTANDAVRFEIPARASSMTVHFDLVPAVPTTGITAKPRPQIDVRQPTQRRITQPARHNGSNTGQSPAPVFQIGAGRVLGQLLFLTDTARLGDKIGPNVVTTIANAVKDGGYDICDVSRAGVTTSRPAAEIREELRAHIENRLGHYPVSQVVIIGGYDVIPAHQIDTIAPETPEETKQILREKDPDDFIVWSDDPYVDVDHEGLPDLPISRIPDGHDALFTLDVLQAEPATAPARQGIRNQYRPFVESIFNLLPGNAQLRVSGPTSSSDLTPDDLQAGRVYLLLHGMHTDARIFYGEKEPLKLVEALSLDLVPTDGIDVAVLGCCWGALPASTIAADWQPGQRLAGRVPDQSIAFGLLAAGARAVIGCTGAHYSPPEANPDAASGPFHRTLWDGINNGKSPAQALFDAKWDYADSVVKLTDPKALAIAYKTLNQFTCLGLGC